MIFTTLLLAGLLTQPAQQTPPRDAKPPAGPGTGVIAGHVVDGETGTPVAGAMVDVRRMRMEGTAPRSTQIEADERGAFRLTGVLAGDYRIFVSPSEHRPTHVSRMLNVDRLAPSMKPSLHLEDGEVRDDLVIRLERAYAIEGRVLDEFGEPMTDAQVTVEPLDAAAFGGSLQHTDDRGLFRIYSLSAGSYRVCAAPGFSPTDARLGRATAGDVADQAYVKTCGQRVEVRPGRSPHVTLMMQRVTGHAISGRVASESGLRNLQVSIHRLDEGGGRTIPVVVKEGVFSARGVPPGEYAVRATGQPDRSGWADSPAPERAMTTVRVGAADLTGIDLLTTKGATIRGRVVPEVPLPPGTKLTVLRGQSFKRLLFAGPAQTVVQQDLTFELRDMHDPILFSVAGLPPDWVVTSVRHGGADITDTLTTLPTTVQPEELEITVSPRSAQLRVRPLDTEGRVVEAARVLLITAAGDRTAVGSRVDLEPAADGALQLPPMPPGEYVIAALRATDVLPRFSDNAAMLRQLGKRIVLEAGRQTIELAVVTIPEAR